MPDHKWTTTRNKFIIMLLYLRNYKVIITKFSSSSSMKFMELCTHVSYIFSFNKCFFVSVLVNVFLSDCWYFGNDMFVG